MSDEMTVLRKTARSLLWLGLVAALSHAGAPAVSGAELRGQVKDVCGRNIPGSDVTLFDSQSGAAFRTSTGAEGRYVFHSISANDSWVLSVVAIGFERERQEILLREDTPLEHNVRLVPDLTLKGTLTVSHGDPTIRFHMFSIVGTVIALNGDPVAGALVTLRNSGFARGYPGTDQCTADELGRYHVSWWLATSAPWILSVESPGLAPYVQSDIELAPDQPRVIEIHLQARRTDSWAARLLLCRSR